MEGTSQSAKVARTACGGQLKDTRDFPSAIYKGERIYFCSQACLRVFEQDADSFMAGQIEHPKKEN
jgi:YHS domain-containing protein